MSFKDLTDNRELNEFNIRIESIKDFTNEVLSDEYFNYDNSRGYNVPYRFDSKLKGHLREVILEEKKATYLYEDDDKLVFMDAISFEQKFLLKELIGEKSELLEDGMEVILNYFQ